MRIDSGLSSYSYQSRHIPNVATLDEPKQDNTSAPAKRATGASTFSNSFLSSQLSSALFTIEGERKGDGQKIATEHQLEDELPEESRIMMVEAAYREYEMPQAYEEF